MMNLSAIPKRHRPIQPNKSDSSHAISIHCSKCYKFALIAPAGQCWNDLYCCPLRGRRQYNEEDGGITIFGGAFTRTKCSVEKCNLPISCHACSHTNVHDSYNQIIEEGGEENSEEIGESTTQKVRKHAAASCDTCCETYCEEHSWITTACHHW